MYFILMMFYRNAKFNVNVKGPNGTVIPVEITSNPDGTFEVTLAPTETGEYLYNFSEIRYCI